MLKIISKSTEETKIMVTVTIVKITEVIAETILQVKIVGLHIEDFVMSMAEDSCQDSKNDERNIPNV